MDHCMAVSVMLQLPLRQQLVGLSNSARHLLRTAFRNYRDPNVSLAVCHYQDHDLYLLTGSPPD